MNNKEYESEARKRYKKRGLYEDPKGDRQGRPKSAAHPADALFGAGQHLSLRTGGGIGS